MISKKAQGLSENFAFLIKVMIALLLLTIAAYVAYKSSQYLLGVNI